MNSCALWCLSFSRPHAAGQALARGLAQVDHLLARDAEETADRQIIERQRAPQLRQLLGRHLQSRGDVVERGRAGDDEESDGARSVAVAQVEQKRRALARQQLLDLLPEAAE